MPDQLRIAKGWVRCGECKESFDATLSLRSINSSERKNTEPFYYPPSLREASESKILEVDAFTSDLRAETDNIKIEDYSLFAGESFLKKNPGPKSMGPWTKVTLLILSLMLLIGLSVQIIRHERNFFANKFPQSKSILERLCIPLQCQIKGLRRVDALVIEAASLFKNQMGYRLEFNIRNKSEFLLEAPGIELTLTDSQDRPIVRRFISPEEIQFPMMSIPQLNVTSLAINVELNLSIPIREVVGYKLIAFYP